MRVNGTEMYLRRFKIYAAATMPASAMSKVDYFRVARDGCTASSNRSPMDTADLPARLVDFVPRGPQTTFDATSSDCYATAFLYPTP